MRIELSTDTVDGAVMAGKLGADRVEMCSASELGGLTPGPGLLASTLSRCEGLVEVHALIRPRAGDFVYSPAEVDAMVADVRYAEAAGASGVVVGALTESGELDMSVLEVLVNTAGTLPVTAHRAVDVCADPVAAVVALAELGVRRVLTSGGAARAEDGVQTLSHMVAEAGNAVTITACGGIRPHNALAIMEATGVRELHAAPRQQVPARDSSAAVDYGTHSVLDVETARALIALKRRPRTS
jgi:copper homeostasis protein